ncbi:hypothetical protein LEP1GSC133_3226 [Leptospira borgpetersenii serovar Pomona str. 200901868]|uniref:Uncharacterized protein n=1 Tax=Leptospira borgpetersenii serovar Pomona str. 200901868 TaxID=1192866 RepID=M6WN36_LEPBO|nr:hypothetical protein LEP1GSC133_3226 [Leptospira borgpetersenii serovar Pomona str. 200901868]
MYAFHKYQCSKSLFSNQNLIDIINSFSFFPFFSFKMRNRNFFSFQSEFHRFRFENFRISEKTNCLSRIRTIVRCERKLTFFRKKNSKGF